MQMKSLHYGWIVVIIAFLTLLAGAGIRSTPGVLMVPLEQEFGWNRTVVSLALAINLLLYGLFGPFAAAFMNRFGIRQVTSFALLLLAAGTFLTTLMQSAWQLYLLWGVIVGIGSGCTVVLSAMVANRWFVKRRGLVVGILTASGATGQLIFLPILAQMVSTEGWRTATLIVSAASVAVLILVAFFMRNHPSDKGLAPYGETEIVTETQQHQGNPISAAIDGLRLASRSRDFWLLAGSFFVCGFSTNGLIGTHFISACIDHGIPEVKAASMLALIGIFDIIGTTLSGWLSDRFNNRWLLFWYYGLRGLSLLFLPSALDSAHLSLWFFIVFYGLDWVATVPPTVRLTTDIFGKQNAGILFGWIMASHQIGAAFAAYGGGFLHDMLNSYYFTFILAGVFCFLAAGIVMGIGKSTAPHLAKTEEM